MTEEQTVVLEIFKQWLEEEDASLLLAENLVVRPDPLGKPVGGKIPWMQEKPSSIVRQIRATRIPLNMMSLCTTDMLLAATQETERLYERGVFMDMDCPARYFNYNQNALNTDPLVLTLERFVTALYERRLNICWKLVVELTDAIWEELKLVPLSKSERNRLLKQACIHIPVDVKLDVSRYNYKGKLYSCLKCDKTSGIILELEEDLKTRLIKRAVNGSTIRDAKGVIASL